MKVHGRLVSGFPARLFDVLTGQNPAVRCSVPYKLPKLQKLVMRGNLVARLKGNGTKKPVLMMGHIDVVGVEREKWTVDPFGGVVRDGFVYGRGAVDDKDMGVACLEVMLLLHRPLRAAERFILDRSTLGDQTRLETGSGERADILSFPTANSSLTHLKREGPPTHLSCRRAATLREAAVIGRRGRSRRGEKAGTQGRCRTYQIIMTLTQKGERNREQQLRLWPGVVAVIVQWLVRFGVPIVVPEATAFAVIGGLVGALAVLVWWAFLSRVPHFERWGAVVLMIVAVAATPRILHQSIVGGMMGMMFGIHVIPGLSLALVVWAVIRRPLTGGLRRATLVAAILVACGVWALVRTDGITGNGHSQFAWRWAQTSEQQLLARAGGDPAALPAAPAAEETPGKRAPRSGGDPPAPRAAHRETLPATLPSPRAVARTRADWPGFRGLHRDGIVTGVRIKTDWASSPPVELWRRPVGPGWSSFAVRDGLLCTQEQRGDFEVVACYDATTGKPVWTHRDAARFWESNGGAGPRGTPTLHDGRVYTFGATGILNALDAGNGVVVWTRNAASDSGAKVPGWGFSSSPLVVDDVVIVAAAGRLAAYDLATGASRWLGPDGGSSYSSPHLLTIGGEEQVLLLSGAGATSVAATDGRVLWKHPWPGGSILQPALTADGGVLITTSNMSGGIGVRRLAVAHGPSGWTVEEVWTSSGLKPYFNDFVVHDGHVFGFDGGILACIDLQDGKRKWKGGRYGHGQLLLLTDQGLLLVLSEEGELALVAAAPGQFTEIARFPAMEGKTWNHPVLAGDILLVRNGQEMVAFRLSLAGG